jgi:hypothetical protein
MEGGNSGINEPSIRGRERDGGICHRRHQFAGSFKNGFLLSTEGSENTASLNCLAQRKRIGSPFVVRGSIYSSVLGQ